MKNQVYKDKNKRNLNSKFENKRIILKSIAKNNNISLISMYSDFDGEDKRKIALETFIFGDLHWNKLGTKIIFNRLISEINF